MGASVGLGLFAIILTLCKDLYEGVAQGKQSFYGRKKIKGTMKKLKQIPQVAFLADTELRTLAKSVKKWDANTEIIKEGSKLDFIYVLLKGSVTVSHANSELTEVMHAPILLMGDNISDNSIGGKAKATVISTEEVETLSVNYDIWVQRLNHIEDTDTESEDSRKEKLLKDLGKKTLIEDHSQEGSMDPIEEIMSNTILNSVFFYIDGML